MDINRALRAAIDTGEVLFGARATARALKGKRVKLIIIASNCQKVHRAEIGKYPDIPVFEFEGNNIELGSACGKPFPISSVAIIDSGSSNIMDIIDNT